MAKIDWQTSIRTAALAFIAVEGGILLYKASGLIDPIQQTIGTAHQAAVEAVKSEVLAQSVATQNKTLVHDLTSRLKAAAGNLESLSHHLAAMAKDAHDRDLVAHADDAIKSLDLAIGGPEKSVRATLGKVESSMSAVDETKDEVVSDMSRIADESVQDLAELRSTVGELKKVIADPAIKSTLKHVDSSTGHADSILESVDDAAKPLRKAKNQALFIIKTATSIITSWFKFTFGL